MRVLLIEDDSELAMTLYRALKTAEFVVNIAQDGQSGLELAMERNYSLIILDLMLPKLDGLRVCERLRQARKSTPILMITARDSVGDRVKGFETGADDYLPKPFDVREFLARSRSLIRRDRVQRTRHLRVRTLAIDTETREVSVAGKLILLTRLEFGILEILASQVGRIVTRDTLLELVWQDSLPGSNKLEVAIRSLRRKLAGEGLDDLVETVYGMGYTIRESA